MTAIFNMLLSWFSGLIDTYFPVFELPDSFFASFLQGVVYLFQMIARLNFMIPFDTVLAPFLILVAIKGVFIAFYIFNWLFTKIIELIPF